MPLALPIRRDAKGVPHTSQGQRPGNRCKKKHAISANGAIHESTATTVTRVRQSHT